MEGKVVKFADLKEGDLVTVVPLNGDAVIEQVKVSYMNSAKNGFDYTLKNSINYAGSAVDSTGKKFVLVRLSTASSVPENWPPKNADVWEVRGDTVHYVPITEFGSSKFVCSHGYSYTQTEIESNVKTAALGKFPENWKLVYRKGDKRQS